MLRMVLVNLIENAVKFTRPRKKARIEIGLLSGRNAEAVIFVRDNGVGFDMAYDDKLFGVFQRLHRTDEFKGIGIGPANVRCIITRHGGQVRAEAKVEQGATFLLFTATIRSRSIDMFAHNAETICSGETVLTLFEDYYGLIGENAYG